MVYYQYIVAAVLSKRWLDVLLTVTRYRLRSFAMYFTTTTTTTTTITTIYNNSNDKFEIKCLYKNYK